MGWTQTDIPDLIGRTAVVTGANGGLGLQTTLALAEAGAHVVMAARNQDKAVAAQARILGRYPDASLEIVPLDLGDLSSVAEAAAMILAAQPEVDILVNNAGLMAMPQRTTADGFEIQLGVDHLGHFALTAHLLPALFAADAARVVTVTSVARFMGGPFDSDDPHLRAGFGAWKGYAQAKMANYHFGLGLHRKLSAANLPVQSLIAHPGLTNTDLQTTTAAAGGAGWSAPLFAAITPVIGMSPVEGVRPQLRAATDPAARGGEFYGPLFVSNGPPVRRPILRSFDLTRRINELWAMSERETGVALDVVAARQALA